MLAELCAPTVAFSEYDLVLMDDERLFGGNTSVVVRVGDTVRRPIGRWTPAVHDLLGHLATTGFDGAPKVLGVDDLDREILKFVPGDVGTLSPADPLASWFRGPEACWLIGRWIRDFQAAQMGFVVDPAKPWRRASGDALGRGQVIAHHDVSPYNTVRRRDGPLVVLDWDFARPGDPVEDLAWAAWRWAPLMAGTWWHAEYGVGQGQDVRAHQQRNISAILDGYGPSQTQRDVLPSAIYDQMASHAADVEDMALTDPAFASLVERDFARVARSDARWWRHTAFQM